MDDIISITNGDRITVEPDVDGGRSIKIENTAFAEQPRWLRVDVIGSHDRDRAITELIFALEQLRDKR